MSDSHEFAPVMGFEIWSKCRVNYFSLYLRRVLRHLIQVLIHIGDGLTTERGFVKNRNWKFGVSDMMRFSQVSLGSKMVVHACWLYQEFRIGYKGRESGYDFSKSIVFWIFVSGPDTASTGFDTASTGRDTLSDFVSRKNTLPLNK